MTSTRVIWQGKAGPTGIPCPQCGGVLELVLDGEVAVPVHPGYHVQGSPLPYRMEQRPFAACSACEFCIEVIPF